MKLGKHGKFLHNFVFAYIHDEISRWDFDLEYSGYIIAHFPGFEDETPNLPQNLQEPLTVLIPPVLG